MTVSIDSFGLTDRGRVREENEDQFLVLGINNSLELRQASLSPESLAGRVGKVEGHLFVVADGVGGGPGGEEASEAVVSALLRYVSETVWCFNRFSVDREHELFETLGDAVRAVHEQLRAGYVRGRGTAPATTLTMVLLIWPRAYFIHVGDSRAYVLRGSRVQRLTRDQTVGDYMVSVGAWTEDQAASSKPGAALASAVGGSDLEPVVGLVDLEPGDALLLCTDGLTRHVSDERIGEALRGPDSAEATCRQLCDEALAAGGRDNITIVVARSAR
jgi:protein phosphatase